MMPQLYLHIHNNNKKQKIDWHLIPPTTLPMSRPFALFENQRRAVVFTQQIMALSFRDINPCIFEWVSEGMASPPCIAPSYLDLVYIGLHSYEVLLKSDWGHDEHYGMTSTVAVGCVWIIYTSPDCVWSDKSQQGTHIAAETTFRLMPSNSPWDYSFIHIFIQSFEEENSPSQHYATLLV